MKNKKQLPLWEVFVIYFISIFTITFIFIYSISEDSMYKTSLSLYISLTVASVITFLVTTTKSNTRRVDRFNKAFKELDSKINDDKTILELRKLYQIDLTQLDSMSLGFFQRTQVLALNVNILQLLVLKLDKQLNITPLITSSQEFTVKRVSVDFRVSNRASPPEIQEVYIRGEIERMLSEKIIRFSEIKIEETQNSNPNYRTYTGSINIGILINKQ